MRFIFLHIEMVWGWLNENNLLSKMQRIDFWYDTDSVLLSIYSISFDISYQHQSMLKCSLDFEVFWCDLSMCLCVCVLTNRHAKWNVTFSRAKWINADTAVIQTKYATEHVFMLWFRLWCWCLRRDTMNTNATCTHRLCCLSSNKPLDLRVGAVYLFLRPLRTSFIIERRILRLISTVFASHV